MPYGRLNRSLTSGGKDGSTSRNRRAARFSDEACKVLRSEVCKFCERWRMGDPEFPSVEPRACELIFDALCEVIRGFMVCNGRSALLGCGVITKQFRKKCRRQLLREIPSC